MDVKKGFLLLLLIAVLCPLWAQQEKDVVLVVDTASSMFSYYNEVGAYLSGPFLAENVADGDTLHIISFGSRPRFEIARKIFGTGDIETAGARIWLLYPLEPSSNPDAAISYAENYVRSIQGGRPKKVFIVSDTDLSAAAASSAGRLSPTEVHFIQAGSRMGSGTAVASAGTAQRQPAAPARTPAQTTAPAASTGRTSAAQASQATSAGSASAVSPNAASPAQVDPVTESGASQAAAVGAAAGTSGAASSAGSAGAAVGSAGAVGAGTAGTASGTTAAGSAAAKESSGAGTSAEASGAATAASGLGSLGIPLPLLIALLLLLLLIIILFIVFRMRSLHSSPKKAMAEYRAGGNAANDAELLNSFASRQAEASLQGPRQYRPRNNSNLFLTTPPMLNIFVEEQNTAIGRRNIHALKQGATYSVGGGNSDFLIFLVKFPASIGRLSFDGSNCTFTPLKSEYFPDIGSRPVTECIGKTIRIISKMNYEVFFHFEPYRDPLLVMNELLNSIKVPEPPSTEA